MKIAVLIDSTTQLPISWEHPVTIASLSLPPSPLIHYIPTSCPPPYFSSSPEKAPKSFLLPVLNLAISLLIVGLCRVPLALSAAYCPDSQSLGSGCRGQFSGHTTFLRRIIFFLPVYGVRKFLLGTSGSQVKRRVRVD